MQITKTRSAVGAEIDGLDLTLEGGPLQAASAGGNFVLGLETMPVAF
ncbi:MAG: hypothetical protein NXI30_13205 [bacterium]|nr:hypothetical protein [bacterium]